MKVNEVMTGGPVVCSPSSSARTAALLMHESDAEAIPVVRDPFTPILVGIVTDRDLCLHVVAAGRDPSSTWIDACMTPDPICCSEQDEVSHVLDLMEEHRIERVPVVNERQEVVGMLSFNDLVQKAAIEASIALSALRHICEPTLVHKERTRQITTAA